MRAITSACIALFLALAASPGAHADTEVYGRINLSLERRGEGQTALADNNSRWGVQESEKLGAGLVAGVHLEQGFAASTGVAANGFDRMAELFVGSEEVKLSLGRFGSTAYLNVTDVVSMHNHDTGISADALFAHVEPLGRKAGLSWQRNGWTAQIVHWTGETPGSAAMVGLDRGPVSLALSFGRDGVRAERSARVLWTGAHLDLAAYVERDSNVRGHGERTLVRGAIGWRIANVEWHVNVGRAGAYSGGEAGAQQATIACNYKLSTRTKVYVLRSRLRDDVTVYGNYRATAVGLRHNF